MPFLRNNALALLLAISPGLAFAQTPPAETPPAEVPAEVPPAEAPPAEDKPAGMVGYDKGFILTSGDGDFELKVVGRLQARYEFFREDDGVNDPVLSHHFMIARARVTLEGHAFGDVDYKMQTEFGRGFVFLRDFYLDKALGQFRVRAGQWKKPYSRQQITSSGSLQLVDRSITDSFAAAGRDIGVAIHNNYEKSPEGLEWALGLFNGTGDRSRLNCTSETDPVTMEITTNCANPTNVPSDIGPQVVARIGFNHGKIKGYSESDLEGGPLRAAVGASYMLDLAEGETDAMTHRVGADFIVKANGASLTGGAYVAKLGDADAEFGFFGQGGYFLTPKKMEIAGRFSMVPAGDENELEVVGGFNLFSHGHSLKWQTDAGILKVTGVDGMEFVARTQAQIIF